MYREGIVFIVSAPSGTGKTTLTDMIIEKHNGIQRSISVTSRTPRGQEKDGVDYFFKTREEFVQMVEEGEFWEHAEIFGNYYGTPKNYVKDKIAQGVDLVFTIDWQGAFQIMSKADVKVVSIFLLPPSMSELRRRLDTRGLDLAESVNTRIKTALDEIVKCSDYDYVVINDDFDVTLEKLESIISSERIKQTSMDDFVKSLLKEGVDNSD